MWQDIISRKKRKDCFRESHLPLGGMAGGLTLWISCLPVCGSMGGVCGGIEGIHVTNISLVLTRKFLAGWLKLHFYGRLKLPIVTEFQGFASWGASN